MRLIATWLIHAAALFALPWIIPSIQVASFGSALLLALALGLINAVLRPLLILLTLPVTLLSLGLFALVINALLFELAGSLIEGVTIGGFWPALWGAIVYSLLSWALSALLLPGRTSTVTVITRKDP